MQTLAQKKAELAAKTAKLVALGYEAPSKDGIVADSGKVVGKLAGKSYVAFKTWGPTFAENFTAAKDLVIVDYQLKEAMKATA